MNLAELMKSGWSLDSELRILKERVQHQSRMIESLTKENATLRAQVGCPKSPTPSEQRMQSKAITRRNEKIAELTKLITQLQAACERYRSERDPVKKSIKGEMKFLAGWYPETFAQK